MEPSLRHFIFGLLCQLILNNYVLGQMNDECQYSKQDSTLFCQTFNSTSLALNDVDIRILHLSQMNISSFTLTSLINLNELIIENSSIISLDITNNKALKHVNLRQLTGLVSLNLSHNHLREINYNDFLQPSLKSIDLSGNEWACSNFSWAVQLEKAGILKNPWNFRCVLQDVDIKWTRRFYSVLLYQNASEVLEEECEKFTPGCSCTFYNLQDNREHLEYNATVSCVDRQLTELPRQLPANTFELNATNNNITNLDNVRFYRNLHYLYADNNKITSALSLRNTEFIQQFLRLSLTFNPLPAEEIPFKEFETNKGRLISLENNSWICSDTLARNVQPWLWKNRQLFQNDMSNMEPKIYCLNENGTPVNVFFLFPAPEKTLDFLLVYYGIIGVEVFLIISVLVKLSFDAYEFYTHDRLPWLARKLFN